MVGARVSGALVCGRGVRGLRVRRRELARQRSGGVRGREGRMRGREGRPWKAACGCVAGRWWPSARNSGLWGLGRRAAVGSELMLTGWWVAGMAWRVGGCWWLVAGGAWSAGGGAWLAAGGRWCVARSRSAGAGGMAAPSRSRSAGAGGARWRGGGVAMDGRLGAAATMTLTVCVFGTPGYDDLRGRLFSYTTSTVVFQMLSRSRMAMRRR